VATCERCGQENAEGFRFCGACGAELSPEKAPRGEVRKTVTVLFADVTGSTALGERLDPESLRRVMGRYFEEMAAVLDRHGGAVEKFIGDAIMAVFGVPVLHEDDALRALRAAAEMRERLEGLNDELDHDFGVRIEQRTGVNTGEVVAGDGASGQRLATGDAVNVAARLEQAAAPGEILIGDQTRRLVRDAVETQAVGPLEAKGKAEPLPAFRLVSISASAVAFERHFGSALVGRRGELDLVGRAFERAISERTCHLFTLLGAAGVGKSRLVLEATEAMGERATVLTGRCLPYGEGITYWPLIEVFRQAGAESELEAALAASAREETSWAVRKALERLAAERPLAVVLDDLHWAEPTFLDLVEGVAEWSRDSPILLLCMARPELLDVRPAWGGGKLNATSVLLEPLSGVEVEELIDVLAEDIELDEDLRSRIKAASEGNPLFLEEMLAMAREDADEVPDVPPTIQALLSARLDRLGSGERTVIERAAVEGRVFHRGAVAELSPAPLRSDVPAHLMALVRKELIRPDESELPGEDAFRFRHLLIRDAAYDSLPKEVRSDLHERFAEWLTRVAGRAEMDEIVGYHLEQAHRYSMELGPLDERAAEIGRRSAERLGEAGLRALARSDMHAAANLLGRAVALVPVDDAARLPLLASLGEALGGVGEPERALDVLDEVIEAASAANELGIEARAQADRIELITLFRPDEVTMDEAQAEGERLIPTLEEFGDDVALSKVWRLLSLPPLMACHYVEMGVGFDRALEHARRGGDQRQLTEILFWLAASAAWGPTPVGEAISRCDELLELARGSAAAESGVEMSLALLHAMAGREAEARTLVSEARSVVQELGMKLFYAGTSMFAGWVELYLGEPEAAEDELRGGHELLDGLGERSQLSTVAALRAEVLCRLGRYAEAEELTRASEEAASAEDVLSQMSWRAQRARALAHRGELAEGERLAREAVALASDTDAPDAIGSCELALAEVLRLRGRSDEAAGHVEEALRLYDAKGISLYADRTRALLAELRS
jgi:class 3 adenylate cyclase